MLGETAQWQTCGPPSRCYGVTGEWRERENRRTEGGIRFAEADWAGYCQSVSTLAGADGFAGRLS
jgi:hypothetical protein